MNEKLGTLEDATYQAERATKYHSEWQGAEQRLSAMTENRDNWRAQANANAIGIERLERELSKSLALENHNNIVRQKNEELESCALVMDDMNKRIAELEHDLNLTIDALIPAQLRIAELEALLQHISNTSTSPDWRPDIKQVLSRKESR
jgi:hypothetical protein